jgi:hypothetical protein
MFKESRFRSQGMLSIHLLNSPLKTLTVAIRADVEDGRVLREGPMKD